MKSNWTDEQKKFLIDNYREPKDIEFILRSMPEKNVKSIKQMADMLGIGVEDKWSKGEINILIDNYLKLSKFNNIYDLLPYRSRGCILKMSKKLGLHRPSPRERVVGLLLSSIGSKNLSADKISEISEMKKRAVLYNLRNKNNSSIFYSLIKDGTELWGARKSFCMKDMAIRNYKKIEPKIKTNKFTIDTLSLAFYPQLRAFR